MLSVEGVFILSYVGLPYPRLTELWWSIHYIITCVLTGNIAGGGMRGVDKTFCGGYYYRSF